MGPPSSVRNIIRYHHDEERLEATRAVVDADFLRVVQSAEFVAALFETPPAPLSMEPAELMQLLERSGEHQEASLATKNLGEIAHILPAISEEAVRFLTGRGC